MLRQCNVGHLSHRPLDPLRAHRLLKVDLYLIAVQVEYVIEQCQHRRPRAKDSDKDGARQRQCPQREQQSCFASKHIAQTKHQGPWKAAHPDHRPIDQTCAPLAQSIVTHRLAHGLACALVHGNEGSDGGNPNSHANLQVQHPGDQAKGVDLIVHHIGAKVGEPAPAGQSQRYGHEQSQPAVERHRGEIDGHDLPTLAADCLHHADLARLLCQQRHGRVHHQETTEKKGQDANHAQGEHQG